MGVDSKYRRESGKNNSAAAARRSASINETIKDRYVCGKLLGSGGFSNVFMCFDCNDSCKKYAMKTEVLERSGIKLLEREKQVLLRIRAYSTSQTLEHLPLIVDHGIHNGQFSFLILPMLGMSLRKLVNISDINLSFKQILQISINILKPIEELHSCSFIHRDIKPANYLFSFDFDPSNHLDYLHTKIYLTDFGLATLYRHSKSGKHLSIDTNAGTMGTPFFKSLSAHNGFTQSRRDDLQSFIYTVVYLLKKSEPVFLDSFDLWYDVDINRVENNNNSLIDPDRHILKLKKRFLRQITASEMIHPLDKIVNTSTSLGFCDEPSYATIFKMLLDAS